MKILIVTEHMAHVINEVGLVYALYFYIVYNYVLNEGSVNSMYCISITYGYSWLRHLAYE